MNTLHVHSVSTFGLNSAVAIVTYCMDTDSTSHKAATGSAIEVQTIQVCSRGQAKIKIQISDYFIIESEESL